MTSGGSGGAASMPVGGAGPDADLPIPDDPVIQTPAGPIRLEPWSDRVIRVIHTVDDKPRATKSLAVIQERPKVPFKVEDTATSVKVSTKLVSATVEKATGKIVFFDASGKTLLAEPDGAAHSLTASAADPATYQSRQSFLVEDGTELYGLGEHQQGHMSYTGLTTTLQQKNGEIGVPVLVSSGGYGLLWDNPALTTVDAGGRAVTVPSANLFGADDQPGGLTAEYFDGQNFEVSRLKRQEPMVDFSWLMSPGGGVAADHFSARFSGSLLSTMAGEYGFTVTADDGARLWVNDKLIVDDWAEHPEVTHTAKIRLEANKKYKLRLEFFENAGAARILLAWHPPDGTRQMIWESEAADAIDYYFMYGPEVDEVIASYRSLTGPPPLFGRWAWGYWQSKEHYDTQAELLSIVHGYRERKLPIDGIVQDWFYWDPEPWGSHHFDPKRYPDPAAMTAEAHQNHFKVLLSVWAKFEPGSANYQALDAAGFLMSPKAPSGTAYYDPFTEPGRKMYWQQIQDSLFNKGFDAWWLDATEPELNAGPSLTDPIWGEFRHFQTKVGSGATVFNAYPLMTTTAVYEGQRAASPDKRVFILTRSAYAGQQRNSAVSWSGDIRGDWPTLKAQIPAGLNFSLSGIPFWNSDIGGFVPGSPLTSPEFRELYLRWFQFGAFCPMFRSHGSGGDREMWRFGPEAQATLLGVDELRYRLLPYIYSTSWRMRNEGYTLMRGLVFDFRSDPEVLDIADQFMFGPALLINPVTDSGATSRAVYLPANTEWYDFWTGTHQPGGTHITAAAPIDHLPIFVHAGSIVPLGPVLQYATERPCDPTELRVYRGADGKFELYEDENDNYNYEKGMRATIPITWTEATQTLTIGAVQGSFPGMLTNRTFNVVFVASAHGAGRGETPTPDKVVAYSGAEVTVKEP